MVDKEEAHRQVKDTPIKGHAIHITTYWGSHHSCSISCRGSGSKVSVNGH